MSDNADTKQAPTPQPKSCECAKCRSCCERNPGWMTPTEATAAINAGLASKLMRDWLTPDHRVGNDENIYLLCPASEGYGGEEAPDMPEMDFVSAMFSTWCKGRCVLLSDDGRCTIHDSGFKPIQCRLVFGCSDEDSNVLGNPASNYDIAKLWDTDEGRAALDLWDAALLKSRGEGTTQR